MTVVWVVLLLWLLLSVPFAVVVGMCIKTGLSRPEPVARRSFVDQIA